MSTMRAAASPSLAALLMLGLFVAGGSTTALALAGPAADGKPAAGAPAAPAGVAVDQERYREAVIASSAQMHETAAHTARTAYEALDGGASSQAARDLGGLDRAQLWVGRFERHHDYSLLGKCVQDYGLSRAAEGNVIQGQLVAGGHAARIVAAAERLAPAEFSSMKAQVGAATDAARVNAALSALFGRGASPEEPDPERVTIETMVLVSLGTRNACQPSQRLLDFVSDTP